SVVIVAVVVVAAIIAAAIIVAACDGTADEGAGDERAARVPPAIVVAVTGAVARIAAIAIVPASAPAPVVHLDHIRLRGCKCGLGKKGRRGIRRRYRGCG